MGASSPLIHELGAIHVTPAARSRLRDEGIELDHYLQRYRHGDWDEDEPTTVESVFAARIEQVRDIPLSEAPPDRLSPAGRAAVGATPLCLAIRARRVG